MEFGRDNPLRCSTEGSDIAVLSCCPRVGVNTFKVPEGVHVEFFRGFAENVFVLGGEFEA